MEAIFEKNSKTKEELKKGIIYKLNILVEPIPDPELKLTMKKILFHKYLPPKTGTSDKKRRARALRHFMYINPLFEQALLEVEEEVEVIQKIERLKTRIEKGKKEGINFKQIRDLYNKLINVINDTNLKIKYLKKEAGYFESIGLLYETAKVYKKIFNLNKTREYIGDMERLILKANKINEKIHGICFKPYSLNNMEIWLSEMLLIRVIQK